MKFFCRWAHSYAGHINYENPAVDQVKRFLSKEIDALQPSVPTESSYIFHLGRMLDMMGEYKKANQMYDRKCCKR